MSKRRHTTAAVTLLLMVAALITGAAHAAEGPCAGLRVTGSGSSAQLACTHGVDRFDAPAFSAYGRVERAPSGTRGAYEEVTTPPGIPCYTRGPFVHVFYAYRPGRPNRLAVRAPLIREAVAQADLVYQTSAARAGATRHVRWLTKGCALVITPVATRYTATSVSGIRSQLQATHRIGRHEKGLVFVDDPRPFGCFGIGELQPDSRASTRVNRNNKATMIAAIDQGCITSVSWSQNGGGIVAAHELGHTLGAVQPDAPHSNHSGHCVDEWDVMCYDDGSHRKLVYLCGPKAEGQGNPLDRLLDCHQDTYFNPKPAKGSYLAKHWNLANSSWLSSAIPTRWDVLSRPTVSIVPPADGLVVGAQVVHVHTDASVSTVELFANDADLGAASRVGPLPDGSLDFTATVPTVADSFGSGGYPVGTVLALTARATDAIGRPTTSAAVTATVASPVVALTAPADRSIVPGPYATTWSATATPAGSRAIVSVALELRDPSYTVSTVVTDSTPVDGWGGPLDLSPYVADYGVELSAVATDSSGSTVRSPWSFVTLQ